MKTKYGHQREFPENRAGECPTAWVLCQQNAPFRSHRFACLVHLTLIKQPFEYQEAVTISQLPSLQSLCLKFPSAVTAFSDEASEGYVMPASCMLTQLTSLNVIISVGLASSFNGISFLTNLRSFSWNNSTNQDRYLPWHSINSLPSLRCLTVAGPDVELPLPVAGMTSLEVLELSRYGKGWWHSLESFTAANCVTKLTCKDWTYHVPNLTPLQRFTALQHLVLIRGAVFKENTFGRSLVC